MRIRFCLERGEWELAVVPSLQIAEDREQRTDERKQMNKKKQKKAGCAGK